MNELMKRLAAGQRVLMDGGTGTELEKRGAAMNTDGWSASATLTHSTLLRDVHKDFIRAGADIIITNTFSTSRHVLTACNLAEHFEAINLKAVQLAQEARDEVAEKHVYIAGAISTTTFSREQPPFKIAEVNFSAQAELYARAGVDFIMLEMMRDIDYTNIALQAALATGLPVWLGYSTERDEHGTVWLYGKKVSFAEALQNLDTTSIPLIAIMHTLTEDVSPSLDILKAHWQGLTGVYAHTGKFVMPNWQFIDLISPKDYAQEVKSWLAQGVQMIGGCCGIGPDHIRELKTLL